MVEQQEVVLGQSLDRVAVLAQVLDPGQAQ
jgi:hypothetical protein